MRLKDGKKGEGVELMLTEFNDDGTINVKATSKNVLDMRCPQIGKAHDRDLELCIRNILVQRELFEKEDPESLCHALDTIALARELIAEQKRTLPKEVRAFVWDVKDTADSQPVDLPFYGYRSAQQ